MPIYMDYHFSPGVTIEEVKSAHVADVNTQDRYNVKYHQFWINEAAGTVFCLMEGPSAEACANVHKEAHGNVACNVVEVNPKLVDVFLGKSHKINHGVVYNVNGEIDSGFRYILVLNLLAKTTETTFLKLEDFKLPVAARQFALKTISAYRGNDVSNFKDDDILAVFKTSHQIMSCALAIKNKFEEEKDNSKWNVEFRMALHYGQPLTKHDGLFVDSIKYTKQLAIIANDKDIILSNSFNLINKQNILNAEEQSLKVISTKQEAFIRSFFKCRNNKRTETEPSIQELCVLLGISRAQLYRKMIAITGRSPIQFLRDLRMHKALALLKDKTLNVSEVALEVGYNNPSHFSKCFQERFGIMPSKLM